MKTGENRELGNARSQEMPGKPRNTESIAIGFNPWVQESIATGFNLWT
jgi:hypothetical protein